MDPDASGRVKFHNFLRVLRLKACPLSVEIFDFLDVERSGSITFKQFLYGSAYIMTLPLFRQACERAFTECLVGENDYLIKQELGDTIRLAIPDLNENEISWLFNLFDSDSDERASKDDFVSCLRRYPLLIALFSQNLLHKDLTTENGNSMLKEFV
ncbi:EF_hand_6 domain-containing protein [Cephalotus follicularis]|uniref:EF_hand_6 domain-containing protein n=1 Tax=Cephalotus follicularis TaxID=3775 RepID=A0A1Q3C8U1_CEPFO|nr:EF_hand_6 domain-containing protein [Cephalotus follicularis]